MKRPVIVELSGLPNSGKTTLLRKIKKLCESNNVNVIIMQEPAELLPENIPKGSIAQNLWITLETLQRSLELTYVTDVDYILLDRGFYNQLFWSTMYKQKDATYSEYITDFMEKFAQRYHVKPDYLYVVDVSVEESLRRRMLAGEKVTFSKKEFLIDYKKEFEEFYKKLDSVLYIDTTNLTEDEVANIVFNKIINL